MMRILIASFVVAVQFTSHDARAAGPAEVASGQKLDSGLGRLPPYAEWNSHPHLRHLVLPQVAHIPGEKLDSGLGDLPLYAHWDRHPELQRLATPAGLRTEARGAGEQDGRVAALRH